MIAHSLVVLASLSAASGEQVIDDIRHRIDQVAQGLFTCFVAGHIRISSRKTGCRRIAACAAPFRTVPVCMRVNSIVL